CRSASLRTGWTPLTKTSAELLHAASRNFHAHGFAGGAERDWSAYDRHVPTVASGYCAPTQWLDRASAIHDFRLSHRICSRASFLWPCVRSSRPQAGPDRGDCALLCLEAGLRVIDIDRDAHCGTCFLSTWWQRWPHSDPSDRTRHLFRCPCRARIVADRFGDGACPGISADCRWSLADRVQLAGRFLHFG